MTSVRRLSAIVFTDMVGYTASAQADEKTALSLRNEQESIIRPLVSAYQGRVVKSTGDGLLLEFGSALKATECALGIQQRLHERSRQGGLTPITVRIGIHVGDVEEQAADILGDAVNIAARVEPLADPGGVCITGEVYTQIHNKLPNDWERIPPRELKGIRQPVVLYRAILPWFRAGTSHPSADSSRIAVLPFANFSPDARDEYFADGLTDEIITVLSQIQDLRVIARTSVFPYKGTGKPLAQIGAELGVSTLLEGSVRMAGDRIRVTAQLIDVNSQAHRWAQAYDRNLEDVFAVQSEVAREVAKALQVRLAKTEEARLGEIRTTPPESYLAFLRGNTALLHSYSEQSLREAQWQFERAIALDPSNARAHAALSETMHFVAVFYRPGDRSQLDRTARELAEKSIHLDPNLADGHSSLGSILYDGLEFVAAEEEAHIALALNPNLTIARMWYSALLSEEGRADDALRELHLAYELDPQSRNVVGTLLRLLVTLRKLEEAKPLLDRFSDLDSGGRLSHEVMALYLIGRADYEAALREIELAESLPPDMGPQKPSIWRATVLALAGRSAEARLVLGELEALPRWHTRNESLALNYGLLGELDVAYRLLNQGVEGGLALQTIRLDPLAEPIRRDVRFAQLLKDLKIPM